ncbi:MAG: tRNA uracil 4-sulfurtransferase ThiI [bacterium]
MKVFLIHTNEIILKGRNRGLFENALFSRLRQDKLLGKFAVKKESNKISVRGFADDDILNIKEALQKVFGIANFALASETKISDDDLNKEALKQLSKKEFKTFAIRCRREDKNFKLNSKDIEIKVGSYINEKLKKKVDLTKPEITCFIEICKNKAYIYEEKEKGAGGLPNAGNKKVVSLISSGIDSPVASYFLMKRGAVVEFVHFHSYPQTSKASIENVKVIVKTLSSFQIECRLHLVPFLEIQKAIAAGADNKLRVLLYRRAMIKIANNIAGKVSALGLVTGESLGQVASQTLPNMKVTHAASQLPIYTPLIGLDKEEIVCQAKKIGTYEISIRPYEDCCTLFVPKNPTTNAKLDLVIKEEEKLSLENLIAEAIKNSQIEDINDK